MSRIRNAGLQFWVIGLQKWRLRPLTTSTQKTAFELKLKKYGEKYKKSETRKHRESVGEGFPLKTKPVKLTEFFKSMFKAKIMISPQNPLVTWPKWRSVQAVCKIKFCEHSRFWKYILLWVGSWYFSHYLATNDPQSRRCWVTLKSKLKRKNVTA